MPYPTVKSDPWKRRLSKRRRRFDLWSERFWKLLVERATMDRQAGDERPISTLVLEMIRDMNQYLYPVGTRSDHEKALASDRRARVRGWPDLRHGLVLEVRLRERGGHQRQFPRVAGSGEQPAGVLAQGACR